MIQEKAYLPNVQPKAAIQIPENPTEADFDDILDWLGNFVEDHINDENTVINIGSVINHERNEMKVYIPGYSAFTLKGTDYVMCYLMDQDADGYEGLEIRSWSEDEFEKYYKEV